MPTLTLPVETKRLLLRPFTEDDFDAVHAIMSRADVNRYLYTEPHDLEQTREGLARRIQHSGPLTNDNDALRLAVVLRDTGQVIGDGLLLLLNAQHRQGEIGFIFHPDFHGHGYAKETAWELLRMGFESCDMHRIIGRCDARNTASAGLMRRLGMRQEAHFRQNEFVKGEWCDELVFAMLAEEWRALQRS